MAVVETAEAGLRAVDRGATVIQIRAPDVTARNLEQHAMRLASQSSVDVVVSSRCDIALAAGLAGVNLPERDIAVRDARALLGARLVGRSVHSLQAAVEAERQGADYVIFGPVWDSASHPDHEASGIAALAAVARMLGIPVLAIGGVTRERIDECHAAGAAGYAAIRLFS